MKHTILDEEYEAVFIDTGRYPPTTALLLRGLAAAIQDSGQEWRPRFGELVSLLKGRGDCLPLVSAGGAYGAGKQILGWYPGPATLLFGAALNSIGTAPNTELQASIEEAREQLRTAGLANATCIQAVVRAATERAGFDKVSVMLREEFAQGMRASGAYSEEQIASLVPKIVQATHDARHRAVLGRWVWAVGEAVDGMYLAPDEALAGRTDADTLFLERPDGGDHFMFGTDSLGPVVRAAQVGCAHAIVRRIVKAPVGA